MSHKNTVKATTVPSPLLFLCQKSLLVIWILNLLKLYLLEKLHQLIVPTFLSASLVSDVTWNRELNHSHTPTFLHRKQKKAEVDQIRKLLIYCFHAAVEQQANQLFLLELLSLERVVVVLLGRTSSLATYPTRQMSMQMKIPGSQTQTLLAEHFVAEDQKEMTRYFTQLHTCGHFSTTKFFMTYLAGEKAQSGSPSD